MVQSKCPVGNCRHFWETLIQTFAAGLKRWDRWQRNIADDDNDDDDDGDCDDDDDGDDDDCDCPWKISHQSLWSNLITLRVGQKHRWQKNFFLRIVSAKTKKIEKPKLFGSDQFVRNFSFLELPWTWFDPTEEVRDSKSLDFILLSVRIMKYQLCMSWIEHASFW